MAVPSSSHLALCQRFGAFVQYANSGIAYSTTDAKEYKPADRALDKAGYPGTDK